MLSLLGRYYAWATPDYILYEMTANQVFLYYEHLNAQLTGNEVVYGDEKIPFKGIKTDNGMVFKK